MGRILQSGTRLAMLLRTRIIGQDLHLKCDKRHRTQELNSSNCESCTETVTPVSSVYCGLNFLHSCSFGKPVQKAQLSPRDRAMRRVNRNLANCHARVQKLRVRQDLNKSKLWSWRVKVGQCAINMCTQPGCGQVVYITCILTTCCGEIF